MNNPIRRLPAILGAVAIVIAVAVALPATPSAARSLAPDSPEMLPAMHHDHHAADDAAQVLAATTTVDIADFSFGPKSISVTAGTTVIWTNRGAEPHTVTGPGFDSGRISPRGTFSFTFATAGTFNYVCDFHSQMTGTVVVSGTAVTPPPPPGTTPPSTPPVTGGPTVDMRDNSFSPASLTVTAGTTVTWVNRGAAMHTVTTNDALFHSGLLAPGKRFSYTFTSPGGYPYLCAIHPAMTGVIVVTGVAATPAATTAPPTPAPIPAPVAAPLKAPTAPAPATGSITTVVIGENNFTPGVTTVRAGTTVVWENHGLVKHTVTSSGPTAFDSGILSRDGRFSVTFSASGSYPYICEIHPGMSGTIDVVGDNGSAPAPAAPVGAPSPTPAAVAALPSDSAHVFIVDNAFDAPKITVSAGKTVTWMNHGQAKHTVTFSSGPSSVVLGSGETFARVFDGPGSYAYVCALHPGMTGIVEVTAPPPAVVVAGRETIGAATTTTSTMPDAGWTLIVLVAALGAMFTITVGGLLAVRVLTSD